MPTTETGQHSDFGGARQAVLPKLRLVYSPSTGLARHRAYPLAIGTTPLGRELPNVDGIEIQDRRISRVHALLRVSSDLAFGVTDNSSKNGTFVNRQPVTGATECQLRDGDVLRVGDSFLIARREPIQPVDGEVAALIGVSPAMMSLRREIRRLASDLATVLILGETGTGKELVAQALHTFSGRSGDFIAVNCAAIPETLAESELFGHVAGAFTGAKGHPGFFRAAHKGTLFLDEIGELPLVLQAKLLRVLQDRAVTPIGAVKPIPCDVRLVAATHRDLPAAVATNKFREDLYARLAGILLPLPALRERREDILLLLAHALGASKPELPPDLIETLLLYPWPRNVREVFQTADHLRVFGSDEALFKRLVPASALAKVEPAPPAKEQDSDPGDDEVAAASPSRGGRPREIPIPERERLIGLLKEHDGNIRQLATILQCSRRQVGRMLEHYNLDRNRFRGKES